MIVEYTKKKRIFAVHKEHAFMKEGIFNRTELLLGKETTGDIASKRVILFGVGGVGSWCAESLIRSGIHHLMPSADVILPSVIQPVS